MKDQVAIAKIMTAHGVRGLVKLRCFLEDPKEIAQYNPLTDDKGRSFTITLKNSLKTDWVAEVNGITDRNDAEKLRNVTLYTARENLPDADDDEFYHIDLIGMMAQTESGDVIGMVIAVDNFGASDILEIKPAGAASFYVPFVEPYLVGVDAEAKIVTIKEYEGFQAL